MSVLHRVPCPRTRARRLLPAVLILLLLAWQSFVVETHVHPLASLPDARRASAGAPHAYAEPARETRRDPGVCPLCQAFSLAGNLLSPTPPAFGLSALGLVIASPATLTLWLRRDRSHAWLGRGPPHRSPTPHT